MVSAYPHLQLHPQEIHACLPGPIFYYLAKNNWPLKVITQVVAFEQKFKDKPNLLGIFFFYSYGLFRPPVSLTRYIKVKEIS